ncbi:uncharacterized protein HKW66_Vig0128210 [Vigna angularis]|uniref:Uncharacterized protein n=1 Tax=Phaseolus angularis TaxID=3914 RepID=A0A8T0K364_PHAAN|nr:uncharacterized protein HKW66_Vig0128210 [Vigna angularis]
MDMRHPLSLQRILISVDRSRDPLKGIDGDADSAHVAAVGVEGLGRDRTYRWRAGKCRLRGLWFVFIARGAAVRLRRTWSCGSSLSHVELRFIFSALGAAVRLLLLRI